MIVNIFAMDITKLNVSKKGFVLDAVTYQALTLLDLNFGFRDHNRILRKKEE